jgi:hypothetical protein
VQNRVAREHDYSFLRSAGQVRRFAELGHLVPVSGGSDFDLHAVSFPYARPQVAVFVERLATQYREACDEKLVVTSLTRPLDRQPRNASDRSVHPTGMAVDLRWSKRKSCRDWLEGVLLDLEHAGILEATRERYPPHYHVALFPRPYASYVERVAGNGAAGAESKAEASPPVAVASRTALSEAASPESDTTLYQIRPGDSLWTIARRHGVSVTELKTQNALRTNRIYAGQVLQVPASR